MNRKKIAFIACVNDDEEFSEALRYIEALTVPEGFETDVIAVREAPSMAGGYNAAMKSSDAKYKIYIHQDVFLIYKELLRDMLDVFQSDDTIAMIGVLGCRVMPENAHAISRWDTGKVFSNEVSCYFRGYEKKEEKAYSEVMAIDGMFMATQYDVEWREDLFAGWDFYDISQSGEFIRNGRRVVIPHQKKYWTFHDNKSSKLSSFDQYRFKYIDEYQDIYPFQKEADSGFAHRQEYENLKERSQQLFVNLINEGKMDEVCEILTEKQNQGFLALRELEIICRIYSEERRLKLEPVIYQKGMGYQHIYARFRTLRHLIKRIEFESGDDSENGRNIAKNYSVYAVAVMILTYTYNKKELYKKLLEIYADFDEEKHRQFLGYQKFFVEAFKEKSQLVLKENSVCFPGERILVMIKKLEGQNAVEFIREYDNVQSVIFVEEYDSELLKQIKKAEVLQATVVKLVAERQERLYEEYRKIIIYGNDMEEYVKLYHDTEIPVVWKTSNGFCGHTRYSRNIIICDNEV